MRCPAAPSHWVIRAARVAGSQTARGGDPVAVGVAVGDGVSRGGGLGVGEAVGGGVLDGGPTKRPQPPRSDPRASTIRRLIGGRCAPMSAIVRILRRTASSARAASGQGGLCG